jgi:hypothetical protein
MIQAGNNFGFTLKALAPRRVVGEMVGKNLDGDRAVQARVPRPIHLAHPARTDRRQDLVGTQFEPSRKRHG